MPYYASSILEAYRDELELTWSAIVRPSLSILDPASAIFLAALITSEVFFSGPLPLLKTNKQKKTTEQRRVYLLVLHTPHCVCFFLILCIVAEQTP